MGAELKSKSNEWARSRIIGHVFCWAASVKRAIAGAEKAMARSRKRAEKGLCTKEESDAFCVQSAAALRAYLDKQVESGVLTPAERKALGHQPSSSR